MRFSKKYLSFVCISVVFVSTASAGSFFNASKKIFSKAMSALQWGITAAPLIANLADAHYTELEFAANALPADDPRSLMVQNILKDTSVRVVMLGPKSGDPAVSFSNIFMGNKYIGVNFWKFPLLAEGVYHHEYAHLRHNHPSKLLLACATAVPLMALFKHIHSRYTITRYGYEAAKKAVPSLVSSILKVPSAVGTVGLSQCAVLHYKRSCEWHADAGVPDEMAAEMADVLAQLPEPNVPFILKTHPPLADRITALRERAAKVEHTRAKSSN